MLVCQAGNSESVPVFSNLRTVTAPCFCGDLQLEANQPIDRCFVSRALYVRLFGSFHVRRGKRENKSVTVPWFNRDDDTETEREKDTRHHHTTSSWHSIRLIVFKPLVV